MGSGSFGGGSGSFGGGSGGGGGGSASSDSAHERILKLTKLTESFNKNPEIGKVRAIVYRLLRDRTRSAFLRVMLSDGMVNFAYRALLSIEAHLRSGATLAEAVSELGGSAGDALVDLTDVICQRGQSADTDERTEDIVHHAVRDLLLRTVGDRQDLYYETALENLGSKFTKIPLENTADIFLGTLIAQALRRDLLDLSDESKAVIATATHEIAISWTDMFKDQGRKKGMRFRDMMQTIGEDYPAYSRGSDE
jgi:hypothetical protein